MEDKPFAARVAQLSRQELEEHLIWCEELFRSFANAFALEADRLRALEADTYSVRVERYDASASAYRQAAAAVRGVGENEY